MDPEFGFAALIFSYFITPCSAVSTAGNVIEKRTKDTVLQTIGKVLQVAPLCFLGMLTLYSGNLYCLLPILPAVISFSIDAAMAIHKKKNLKDVENIFSKIYLTIFKVINIAAILCTIYFAIGTLTTLPFALVNIAFLAIQVYSPVKNFVNKAIEYHHIIEEHKKRLAEQS